MANELNIGNITKNSTVDNILSEGSVNVTEDCYRSSVNIGDTVEGVSATNVHFLSDIIYSNLSNSNVEPSTSSQCNNSIRLHGDGAQNNVFAPLYVSIGSTNQNVTAKSLRNTVNVAKSINHNTVNAFNVLPKIEQRPICFRYQSPVHDFIGREEELNFLEAKLSIENPQIIVVSGLGGIGKTQLVKKFIERNRKFYCNIVWINSQRKESVEEEFKILAESELDILLKVDGGRERDFRTIIGMVFDKLSAAKTLLVFDNVDKIDTLEIVRDIDAVAVKPHILITSRIQEFSDSVTCRKLEVFSSQESIDYISTKLSDQNDRGILLKTYLPKSDAFSSGLFYVCLDRYVFKRIPHNESFAEKRVLADTLMNLPLGLRQATGHIRYHRKLDKNYKICTYIADFNKYREDALNSDLFKNDMYNQYTETVLTTWKLTMDAIKASKPYGELALRILQIMAYFDNVNIVREIFFNLKDLPTKPELREKNVMSSVALICNYSMIDEYEHQSVLSIHKLVQEVIKIELENVQQSEPTLRDGLHLISQMEENEKFKVCLAHGISVYLSALRFRDLVIEFDTYPSMILHHLDKTGSYLRAFSFANEISQQFTTILGVEHANTARFKFRMSESYGNLGRYSEALQMYEEVLEKQKIVLGENHPHTIDTKHNIAHSYGKLGKCSEALLMFEKVLEKQKIILGEEHTLTIATMHNIAQTYGSLGKISEALRMYEVVLEKQKIVLGEDHKRTIATKHNIAHSYGRLGRFSEALQMNEEVLEKHKLILGENHPDTIISKHNTAYWYGNLGKYSEALQMFEDVLEKQNMILGEDHPNTILTKHSIAKSYGNLGKYFQALQMYEKVLEKQKIVLGEDHPSTIITKHNIAYSYSKMGKYTEALRSYEEVLGKRKITLGEDHPSTITTNHNIALLYGKMGKYSESLQMFEEVLHKQKIVLGEDHPSTITTKHNTAHSCGKLGRYSEALQMYEEVLAKRKTILGEDHRDTITTKHNIAQLYGDLGKHSESLQMYERVLEKEKILLGEDHPDTITTKHNIAQSYGKLGKFSKALQIYEDVMATRKIILGEDHPDTIVTKSKIVDMRKKIKAKNQMSALYICIFAVLCYYIFRLINDRFPV